MNITLVAIAAVVTNGFLLFGVVGLWLRHRSLQDADAERVKQTDQLERLAVEVRTLQTTLEAVAIEVERIGEEQRYATRLLRERSEGATPPKPQLSAPPRVITPH